MTRAIGIDYDGATLRIVVLQTEKGRERLLHSARLPWDGVAPLAPLLAERGVTPAVGDRVTTALPPATGFTRTLHFPFSDRRKIEAAVPLELAALLPVPLDDCVVAQQEAVAADSGVSVVAAAAPATAVAQTVAPFDSAGLPLQTVDLFPFALAAGLATELGDGLALCLTRGWGTILILAEGRLRDYRVIPLAGELAPELKAAQLLRELGPLLRSTRSAAIRLFGPAIDEALLAALQSAPQNFSVLTGLPVDGDDVVADEFLPALALARRGAQAKGAGFNFRRGSFSRHGESAALRSRLLILAAIVGVAAALFAGSAGLRWWGKAKAADALKKELTAVYRQALPGSGAIVDVTQQLRAHLAEQTRQSRPGGQHPLLTPAALMREVSLRIPTGMDVTFREWNIGSEEMRIEAFAPNFDAANQVAAALSASPFFARVEVVDAKASADNSKVDFRLTITCRLPEELP